MLYQDPICVGSPNWLAALCCLAPSCCMLCCALVNLCKETNTWHCTKKPNAAFANIQVVKVKVFSCCAMCCPNRNTWTFLAAVLCPCSWTYHQHTGSADSQLSPLCTLWRYGLQLPPIGVYHSASLWWLIANVRTGSTANDYLIRIQTEKPHQTL